MWGSNPFTSYQQMPYSSGPQSFSMGQGYGGQSMNGQFNPGALDFTNTMGSGQMPGVGPMDGGMGSPLTGWGGNASSLGGAWNNYSPQQSYGSGSSGSGGMPSWGGQGQGSMRGGMLGASPWQSQGQSPWMNQGMGGGMPPWMRGGMGGGMNPASRFGGGMNYQTMPYAQPTQPAAQAADPNGMNGIYGNVVHNGTFDSANGGIFGLATRSLAGLS